jgi:hypothetical protein
VKTTNYGIEAPFYISRRELAVSRSEAEHYRLVRLFNFRSKPQMFEIQGAVDDRCALDPVTFVASFRGSTAREFA